MREANKTLAQIDLVRQMSTKTNERDLVASHRAAAQQDGDGEEQDEEAEEERRKQKEREKNIKLLRKQVLALT